MDLGGQRLAPGGLRHQHPCRVRAHGFPHPPYDQPQQLLTGLRVEDAPLDIGQGAPPRPGPASDSDHADHQWSRVASSGSGVVSSPAGTSPDWTAYTAA